MATGRSLSPAAGQLEISVFGARKGECCVVHLPTGVWIVIDSFRIRAGSTTAPVAIAYLDLLGVTAVDGIFVTHWHDDHSDGAAELIQRYAATLRMVGVPTGTGERELAAFIADMLPNPGRAKIIEDFVAVLGALTEPGAAIHRVLLTDGSMLSPPGVPWNLVALSPSLEDQRHHAATLARFLPGQKGAKVSFDVNSGSSVLKLEANNVVAIFSSDLDIGETDQRGWRWIVKFHGAALGSHFVKVGHHGSKTALCYQAWQAFAAGRPEKPLAAVTPFPARGGPLPRGPEVASIKKLSRRLHLSGVRAGTTRAGTVAVGRTPFTTYSKVSPRTFDQVGHVRYRFGLTGPPSVEVFPPALEL